MKRYGPKGNEGDIAGFEDNLRISSLLSLRSRNSFLPFPKEAISFCYLAKYLLECNANLENIEFVICLINIGFTCFKDKYELKKLISLIRNSPLNIFHPQIIVIDKLTICIFIIFWKIVLTLWLNLSEIIVNWNPTQHLVAHFEMKN